MSSEQSSFRDMYSYPLEGTTQRHPKNAIKGSRVKKTPQTPNKQAKQSFFGVVQRAKHVAMFTQTLKQKIAARRTLNMHTLKSNQMQFLQNDSEVESASIYFKHDNKFILGFEIAFIIVILSYLWRCTFQLVFGYCFDQQIILILALTAYIAHAVIFNITQYKNQKFEIITNRNLINQLYFKEKLAKDVVFLISGIIQLTPIDDNQHLGCVFVIVRLISLIGYVELSKSCAKIEDVLSVSNQAEIYISMFKLLFKVGLFLHFLSLALNLLAQLETYEMIGQSWLTGNDLDYSTAMDKYIIAWYWGATILSTVGFGEITPKNNYERFFISIVQIICCMTIGYFVNVIGGLFKMKAEFEEKYDKQVRSLNRCLDFLTASNDLKHKIKTHYFNRHMIEKIHDPNEEHLLFQNLTPNLQKTLLQENNTTILKKNNLMKKFKEQTLYKLAHLMKKVILAPQHILYSRNSQDRKLWFIQNGQIQEYTDNFQDSKLRKLIYSYTQDDSLVGWINFLTRSAYRSIAKAKMFTIVYELEEDGFMATLGEDQRQYYKFMHMRQEMIEKNRKFIHKCISCDRYSHNVINCPRIHFIRRDIKRLAVQYKHLTHYREQQAKTRKYPRMNIHYNWKSNFGNGQLQKQANMLMNNDSIRVSNTGINLENLFKNAIFRESIIGFERKKMSFLITKKQARPQFPPEAKENKQNVRQSCDTRSIVSCDEIVDSTDTFQYDRALLNKEFNDYMPDHDVEKIISLYANKFTRKAGPLCKINKEYSS